MKHREKYLCSKTTILYPLFLSRKILKNHAPGATYPWGYLHLILPSFIIRYQPYRPVNLWNRYDTRYALSALIECTNPGNIISIIRYVDHESALCFYERQNVTAEGEFAEKAVETAFMRGDIQLWSNMCILYNREFLAQARGRCKTLRHAAFVCVYVLFPNIESCRETGSVHCKREATEKVYLAIDLRLNRTVCVFCFVMALFILVSE